MEGSQIVYTVLFLLYIPVFWLTYKIRQEDKKQRATQQRGLFGCFLGAMIIMVPTYSVIVIVILVVGNIGIYLSKLF